MAHCYLCRSSENLTRDHIPPKALFPKPRPSNLITVDCCYTCNHEFKKIDEQFRLFVACPINASETGKAIWRDRVVGSTIPSRRIAKEIREMAASIKEGYLETPTGNIPASALMISVEPVQRCLIRITKGLLTTFYPEIDYTNFVFEITQFDQFKLRRTLESIPHPFTYDERGGGVFRFWRGIAVDNHSHGLWVYSFYDAAGFMVRHSPSE